MEEVQNWGKRKINYMQEEMIMFDEENKKRKRMVEGNTLVL